MSAGLSGQSFFDWSMKWLDENHARHTGVTVQDLEPRIERLLALWDAPIPEGWVLDEGIEPRLRQEPRFQRHPKGGVPKLGSEIELESQVLADPLDAVIVPGRTVLDGVNAVPLVRKPTGHPDPQAYSKVEADLLLLTDSPEGEYRQMLLEVKTNANNPFYATVEYLRQLKLVRDSKPLRSLFTQRPAGAALPPEIETDGGVLAPAAYFTADGQKASASDSARALIGAFRDHTGLDVDLFAWHAQSRTIAPAV